MPTARGWMIACAGVGLWVTGRAFGAGGLEQLGFGLLALVILSIFVVRRGRHELEVSRSVTPIRTQAGREVTITVSLKNVGRGTSPVLLAEDHLPARLSGRARFALGGVEPGGERKATYKIRPARRGDYSVGPLEIVVADPFGVARRSVLVPGTTSFLIHPRTEPLTLPKDSGRRRSALNSARRQPTGSRGEDFYTLRDYAEGDDLRRVHWPATAKRGRFMIRQEETPWHARATVLLDDRPGIHTTDDWERAVGAAASLVEMFAGSGYWFRLAGATHPGVSNARGTDHLHRCMDILATASPRAAEADDIDPMVRRLAEIEAQPFAEGSLMIVTGLVTDEIARALSLASRRFRMVGAISIVRAAPAAQAGPMASGPAILLRAGAKHIQIPPGASLASAWSAAWRAGLGSGGEGGGRPSEAKPARA